MASPESPRSSCGASHHPGRLAVRLVQTAWLLPPERRRKLSTAEKKSFVPGSLGTYSTENSARHARLAKPLSRACQIRIGLQVLFDLAEKMPPEIFVIEARSVGAPPVGIHRQHAHVVLDALRHMWIGVVVIPREDIDAALLGLGQHLF